MIRKRDIKVLGVVLLFGFLCFSQNTSDAIKIKAIDSLTQKMFSYMIDRDFDAILDLTHPKVFEILPKESMKSVLKSTLEGNEEFSIELPNTVPDYKISELFKGEENNLEYAFVSYNLQTKMTFHKQEFDADIKDMMISMMRLKGMDVTFISDNTLNILMNNRMTIVMRDKHTDNKWVMINYDAESPLFYQVVPTVVLEKAKMYYQDLMIESKKKKETN